MFRCYFVFWNVGSHIESSLLSFVLLIIKLQPATRRTHCWKALKTKQKKCLMWKNSEKNCWKKKNWKKNIETKNVEKKYFKIPLIIKKVMDQDSIFRYKSSGSWMRILLFIKKVLGNGSEFHCSLKSSG